MDKPAFSEQSRLEALKSFHILDSPSEEIFDRLTQLGARICETPIAVITLVDEDRQWFKSVVGLDVRQTAREISFCTHTVAHKKLFIVSDARLDPEFSDNPLVTGDPGIVFYAGAPLISPDGFALGALAVIDRVPRTLTETQIAVLNMLAEQIMMHFELRLQHHELENLAADRDRINEALRRQTEHLKKAQQIAETGSWELHLENRTIHCSEEIFRILGVDKKEVVGSIDSLMPFVHPDDRWRLRIATERTLRGEGPLDVEHRIIRPDGEMRHVHERGELSVDETGQRILAGTIQDVTGRRITQEQMHLLKTCVSRLHDIVMITEAEPIDEPGPRIVFVNEAFERITGYSLEEVIGRSPRLLQGPKTQRAERDRIRAALEKHVPVSIELINYTKSGEEIWVEMDITPVAQEPGRFTHFVSIQRDITARKQQMHELTSTYRALQMLTRCNEALVHTESEQELVEQVCRLSVDVGGYCLAWVGYAQDDEARTIKIMAHAWGPSEAASSPRVELSWSQDHPFGQGPSGRAIRSGSPVVVENVGKDPTFAPWLEFAQNFEYSRVISLPLHSKGHPFGVLSLYNTEIRTISEQEIKLLQEVADNLAFGIMAIRTQKERRRIENAIVKVAAGVSGATGSEFFERLARNMAESLSAQGAFITRYLPGEPFTARVISAVVDGEKMPNFDYPLINSPCERVRIASECVVPNRVKELFSGAYAQAPPLASQNMRAYVGRRLDSSAGQPLGSLFVLFREPIAQAELMTSTLRIFAARAAAELERQEADARIQSQASLLDKAQDAIVVCGTDYRISFWNKGAERLYGWAREEVLGRNQLELIYRDSVALADATHAVMRHGEWRGETEQRRKDGTMLVVEAHWTLVKDDTAQSTSILTINTDVTQRKAGEKEIERLAFFDPLTRLPNRRLLLDRLEHALGICSRSGHTGALLFIDLDNFKSLNDTLGHDKGDLLLQHVARRLETCVRKSNTVARLGGDEFVVMLEDLSGNPIEAAAQAEIVGEKILAAFTLPFQLGEVEHHSTPSVGITLFNDQSSSIEELLKRADLAMYQAKASGRNAIRFFDPEMQDIVSARVALETDFRHGLQQREFFLHYQAQTDGYGHIKGVEALVRWRHAERGMVAPSAFIPLAEETGLILRLGYWVLETACHQLASWAESPQTAHLSVAVNVSARQFHHPSFVEQVLDVLDYTGANPKNLKLELTESLLVKNVEDTIAKMNALKEKGISFSLDDFGTGYSSLSYLKRFPLDQLKIDRSFVRDVLVDANDAAIARTIVALGQILGLEVIAEGVETEDQRDFLARHGCHAYQGFLFSQPLPAEQFGIANTMH